MAATNETVVLPNQLRLFGILILTCIGVASCILLLVGMGQLEIVLSAGFAVITLLFFICAVLRQRPRIVITPNGFTIYMLFGKESHLWQDIEGPFTVIKVGLIKTIGYRFTVIYKARTKRKPASSLAGHDAAIMGAYVLSPEKLADLLNAHHRADTSKPVTSSKVTHDNFDFLAEADG